MYDELELYLENFGYHESLEMVDKVLIYREALKVADKTINHHGDDEISDAAYTKLLQITNVLENKLKLRLSVGQLEPVISKSLKPRYSVRRVHDGKEVIDILNKYEQDDLVTIEPKLDGVSMTICYREYTFSHIRINHKTFNREFVSKLPIRNIQSILNCEHVLPDIDVSGEVVIDLDTFEEYAGSYNNPRTIVAAMLNSSDVTTLAYPSDTFDFIVYNTLPNVDLCSAFQQIDFNIARVYEVIEVIETNKLDTYKDPDYRYYVDGLVFKLTEYDHLSNSTQYPDNHIALKNSNEFKEARVLNIDIEDAEVKQTVTVTIEPTTIESIVVSEIIISNLSILKLLDIKVNDRVRFTMIGGLIPRIVGKVY